MLRNFFKTAYRNIVKNKVYAIINFIGLTTGLALCLLIIVYVRSETGYDQFHTKIDRLYRINYEAPNGLLLASSPPPLAPAMKDYFAEVEETARMYNRNVSINRTGKSEHFEESNVYFVDSTIFSLFSFDVVSGDVRSLLHNRFTVVINEEMGHKYFGKNDPVGESLTFSGNTPFKVVAVVKNFPEQSHLRFNMLVPYENMFDMETPQTADILRNNLAINFIISHGYTYVLLRPGADPTKVDARMDDLLKKYAKPELLVGQKFTLTPVRDIHLRSEMLAEPSPTNSWNTLYLFIGIGIVTLLIACINYINLSTAQSFTRIKEIGVRKILGSMRYQLILQFLAESFLFSAVSMIMAYVLFYNSLPLLNLVTDKNLLFTESIDSKLLLGSISLVVFMTLMAGGYPAYFVTQFESVNALKSASYASGGDQYLRKSLVVFQLCIACMLLSGSLLIVRQMGFLEDRSLGFEKQKVINVPLYSQNLNSIFASTDSTYRSRLQSFREIVERQSAVVNTSLSSAAPGLGATYRNTIPEGFTAEDNIFSAAMSVDYDFVKAYGMEIVAGRAFSRDYPSDEQNAYVVNESALTEFKWGTPQQAIGKTIDKEGKKGTVVGIIKDFNFASLQTPMSALIIDLNPDQFNTLSIRYSSDDATKIVEQLRRDWNTVFPEKAFEFTYLEEQLRGQYATFQNFSLIIQTFTGIAVLISCLGVYGLVLFTVQRKFKEIGVRKVLGANIRNILFMIYRDFALLLAIGFILAIPLSWFLMNKWLDNFIYHTSVSPVTYVISLVIVMLVMSVTISYQAIRAALGNPVNALRSE
ncbi:MAG TPA: ABC transporter permease [Chryseolinea sp.]|nr:ABC transporter permease [Chryseolinea sp.]